tara:strand:+ start:585 stop:908 length:324 start_codon:yes stop_codon:yes gene_type:complete
MTATTAPTVKDQELVPFGLVESASVNSFADFIPSEFNKSQVNTEKENNNDDFNNTFICHLIFYAVFCVALVLHILIDLGVGTFIQNKFVQLKGLGRKNFVQKSPAFA